MVGVVVCRIFGCYCLRSCGAIPGWGFGGVNEPIIHHGSVITIEEIISWNNDQWEFDMIIRSQADRIRSQLITGQCHKKEGIRGIEKKFTKINWRKKGSHFGTATLAKASDYLLWIYNKLAWCLQKKIEWGFEKLFLKNVLHTKRKMAPNFIKKTIARCFWNGSFFC